MNFDKIIEKSKILKIIVLYSENIGKFSLCLTIVLNFTKLNYQRWKDNYVLLKISIKNDTTWFYFYVPFIKNFF